MGGSSTKQQSAPKPSIDDIIIDMKMTSKKFEMESRQAERQSKKGILPF
jgi:hypothetical protein